MSILLFLLLVLFIGALAAVLFLRAALSRARNELERAVADRDNLEKMAATARQQGLAAQQAHDALAEFIREFPHSTRRLHVYEREIPGTLVEIVKRFLGPRATVVLLRRHKAINDQDRENTMIVTGVDPPAGPPRAGTIIRIGEGELGFVASTRRTMTRADFESQTAVTRQKLKGEALPGFEPDLAAPMLFEDSALGVIAVQRPEKGGADARSILRVIASVGALAINGSHAYRTARGDAESDGLTRVYNKRYMGQRLSDEILKAQRDIAAVSIFLFDIDNFKNYNDANGHVAGDQLLKELARLVDDHMRQENIFGRFGGEEFLAIFPGQQAVAALAVAERIRQLIAGHPFHHAEKQPLKRVSVSGGVAEYPTDAQDSAELLRAADRALYEAKRQGRDRVLRAVSHYFGGDEEPPDPGAPTGH